MMLLITAAQAATETHRAAEAAGIGALGLDARALVFQLLNFAILLGLLRAFAYKPIVKVLEDRRRRIEESLQNAQDIAQQKAALEQTKQNIIKEAHQKAQDILGKSTQQAQQIVAAAETKATRQAEQIITQAEAKLTQEVAQVKKELKHEVIGLVALATEKIIDEKLDASKDAELISRAIAEVQQQS